MKKKLSREELSSLCLELSLLLHGGVLLGDALALLAQEETGENRQLLSQLAQWVDDGETLSAAMEKSGAFPGYAAGLTRVGEQSGQTEEALNALGEYYEAQSRMEKQIRSALLYPAVMLAVMLVVIGVLLVKVMPIFDQVYAGLGSRLTGLAGGLLALGQGLKAALPVLFLVLFLVAALAAALVISPVARQKLAGLFGIGLGDRGLSRKLADARVAQALAMALESGMDASQALELAGRLVAENAPAARERCLEARRRLEAGDGLSRALGDSGLLPAAQCRLLEAAGRSGGLDKAMAHVAERLAEESDAALARRVGRVEPAMVLTAAVLVGIILLSVMLPLANVMSAIG